MNKLLKLINELVGCNNKEMWKDDFINIPNNKDS